MIASFRLRPRAQARFGHRNTGGPVQVIAQSLHARLYGLPTDPEPLPTALDELLQATITAESGDEQAAVLIQLAEQLRNAAEIIKWAQYHAHWRHLPAPVFDSLKTATATVQQLADGLEHTSPAFTTPPAKAPAPTPAAPAPLPALPAVPSSATARR